MPKEKSDYKKFHLILYIQNFMKFKFFRNNRNISEYLQVKCFSWDGRKE